MGACSSQPEVIDEQEEHHPYIRKEGDIKLTYNNLVLASRGALSAKYQILASLGSGAFGKVYKVLYIPLNAPRAMKVVKRDSINYQDDNQTFLKEIEALMNLDHPNIIKIFEYYIDDLNYYVIMEFAEGGELYDQIYRLKSFQEKHAARIMQQLLSAVCYMHSKGIVHRDLKPENILLENKKDKDLSVKIIDFGTSNKISKNQRLSMKVGTPYYIAPEVLTKSYNSKCDIWSLGVILYVLLSGFPPFDGPDDESILAKVKKGKYSISEGWEGISAEAKDLVKKMLTYNPDERISAAEALQHEWLKKCNNEDDIEIKKTEKAMLSVKPFENLRKIKAKQKIQQATIAFLVHHVSSSDMVKELKEIFQSLDTDGNGTLSYQEIKEGFNKYSQKISDHEFDQIMNEIDADKNECIEYEEFIAATINLEKLLTDEYLKMAFNSFDKDGSKELSSDEIKQALGLIEEDTDGNLIKNIIQEIDENGDGNISYSEFKNLMLKVIEK